jgi:hypothetical protein
MLYKTLVSPVLTYGKNVGPSQRRMEKCSELFKEEY